jgi:hypothetical protein
LKEIQALKESKKVEDEKLEEKKILDQVEILVTQEKYNEALA